MVAIQEEIAAWREKKEFLEASEVYNIWLNSDERMNCIEEEDWQHLYRYCGNNPRKKLIQSKIRELGGEVKS